MSESLMEGLHQVGLRVRSDAVLALAAHVTKNQLSFLDGLEQLVRIERREREARNLKTQMKLAKLGAVKPLDQFDWQHPRHLDQGLYRHLAELDFLG